jgi:hypothetical protein
VSGPDAPAGEPDDQDDIPDHIVPDPFVAGQRYFELLGVLAEEKRRGAVDPPPLIVTRPSCSPERPR